MPPITTPESPAEPCEGAAWVVLLTNDDYLAGLLVLHRSLQEHGTAYPLVVQTLPRVTVQARAVIEAAGMRIIDVEAILPVGLDSLSCPKNEGAPAGRRERERQAGRHVPAKVRGCLDVSRREHCCRS
jgi:hypothetical protein